MQVERVPMLGIALAVVVLVVEGLGLMAVRDARLERVDADAVTQRVFEPEVAPLRKRLSVIETDLERVRAELAELDRRAPATCGTIYVEQLREQQELLALHRQLVADVHELRAAALLK